MSPTTAAATAIAKTINGFKTRIGTRPLSALASAFDSRSGGSTNPKHIESILALLEVNNGQLKSPVIITEDNKLATSRHGVEALLRYHSNTDVEIPVVILNVKWAGISAKDELALREIAYDENARNEVKLSNELADTTMLVNRMVRFGLSDSQIRSRLSGNTLAPLLNKAIKTARQSASQSKRAAFVELREQGVAFAEAVKAAKIPVVTAKKAEQTLQGKTSSEEETRVRLHKMSKSTDVLISSWGRLTDKAIRDNLTQAQRRSVYQHMEKMIARLQRKQLMAKTTIEDFIVNNAERIR